MNCSFEKLVLYLDRKLDLDAQLELLEHLEKCGNCFDAVYHISRDRDARLFVRRPMELEVLVSS
jgi:Putative zinc-finger